MNALYKRMTQTALKLLKKYGESCTVAERVAVASTNPDKPWEVQNGAPVTHSGIKVAFFPMNQRQYKKAQLIAKTEIPIGYEMAYMGQVSFNPDTMTTVTRSNGHVYSIREYDSIDPDGSGVILYELLVER